ARLVDGVARHLLRNSRLELRDAARIEAEARGKHVTKDHFLDLARLELGPSDRLADDDGPEPGGRDLRECPTQGADRGASRADDHGCGHLETPPLTRRVAADCSTGPRKCT